MKSPSPAELIWPIAAFPTLTGASGLTPFANGTINVGGSQIDYSTLADCESISSLDLGERLIFIVYGAFTYATDGSIDYVVLPSSLQELDPEAFADSYIPAAYCCFSED